MEYWNELNRYLNAFYNSRPKLRKLDLYTNTSREADFSAIFKHYEYINNIGSALKGSKIPSHSSVFKVLQQIKTSWDIDETNNTLVRKLVTDITPLPTSVPANQEGIAIKAYNNYDEANIGLAIEQSQGEVWILNTYLSNRIYDEEVSGNSNQSLRYWLKNGKKVKILLLYPDGKAMRLRMQSLTKDMDSATLAKKLVSDLEKLLGEKDKYPKLLDIKLMDELPGAPAIILENQLFFGLHYSYGHSELGPFYHLYKNPKNSMYDSIKEHFLHIWDDQGRSSTLSKTLVNSIKHRLHVADPKLDYLHDKTWQINLYNLGDMILGHETAPFTTSKGEIESWSLKIERDPKDVYLKATIYIRDVYTFSANLITERILDTDYAHARFSDHKNLSVHISFQCSIKTVNDALLGFIVINSGSDSCACYAILAPKGSEGSGKNDLLPYYQRLLSFRDSSYMSLARTATERDNFKFPYAGTYKVYSYGGPKGGKKCIKINWLHIDKAGISTYKNKNLTIFGRATHIAPNLHFVFTHYRDKAEQRRSYFILSVNQTEPEKGRFYCGVFLGVSWEKHMPVGKRFVLEYVEDVDFESQVPNTIELQSKEYRKTPKAIRKLLSGRIKNLLGFLRKEGQIADMADLEKEYKQSLDLGQVFADSAVQHLKRDECEKSAKMFLRAVNHGYEDLDAFIKEAHEISPALLKKCQSCDDYKIAEDIIKMID